MALLLGVERHLVGVLVAFPVADDASVLFAVSIGTSFSNAHSSLRLFLFLLDL